MPTAAAPAPADHPADPIGSRTYCSGDPSNLAGNAHWWSEFGEDHRGTLYRCEVCGVTDFG
ncbi:hypothetical protein MF672_000495 [Actinomadura sp. ATCC 31491]|uniref:Uncharacterized protein n=1 Tax=Actinomadura luzonensis TaxID=2805427 RepID=A0ABT0FJA6_9ACTN|nr:hypothetical protein [Actinomadura luzonensis]MCK2212283.1 hypothetical protein [Actinomadura luzonensis]